MKRVFSLLLCAAGALAQERPPSPVVVETVVEREVVARRSFVGSVEAVRTSTAGAEEEGLVVEYLVEEGQRVEEKQPLARLRTTLLEARIDAARAELKLRGEELNEQRNGARPEEIDQAKARLDRAQAAFDIGQWKYERAQQLFGSSVISEDELKDARLVARLAEENLDEARAALNLVEAGPRAERIAQAAARVEEQEAILRELTEQLANHTIRAPFAGYVVVERTQVGEWLKRGDPVAELVAVDEVDVTVPVLEDYVLGLRVGEEVPVTVGAIPGRTFTGRLVAVVPRADPQARTFPVKVRLQNALEDGRLVLQPGMFAAIHLRVGEPERGLVVSKDALVLGGPAPVVFIVDPETATVQRVPVETGIAMDGQVQVKGQLQAGQKVVVRGNERLQPGQKVAATEAGS